MTSKLDRLPFLLLPFLLRLFLLVLVVATRHQHWWMMNTNHMKFEMLNGKGGLFSVFASQKGGQGTWFSCVCLVCVCACLVLWMVQY